MRPLILLLALCCLSPFASATAYEDAIGVTFPDEIGGLQLRGRETFPQKALGAATRYVLDGPVQGSVYVYTGGLSSIPDGTESAIVRKHFAQVIGEVKQMAAPGLANRVTVPSTPDQTTSLGGCGPQFIWKGYEMELDGTVLASYTYLTVVRNNFVKLRISYLKSNAAGRSTADRFIEGVRKVVGRC
ncbi:hypothetical protein [Variovorax sp.]|uniref:hypothetical protein n=1 Tax=Variovorax sp. TaxID=1871043 RepID=UPI003BAD754D